MFDAIASPKPSVRSARSVILSIAIHAACVGVALIVAGLTVHERALPSVDVRVTPFRPGTAPAPREPSENKRPPPRADRARRKPVARPIVEPTEMPRPIEVPPPAVPEREEIGSGEIDGVIGGDPDGLVVGPSGSGSWPAEFDDRMAAPRMIAGRNPEYTREALEREIQGTMLVKCVVTTNGDVRDCRVLKSLPFMDREVIEALENRRYTPALLHGRAIDVEYTFRIYLRLPW